MAEEVKALAIAYPSRPPKISKTRKRFWNLIYKKFKFAQSRLLLADARASRLTPPRQSQSVVFRNALCVPAFLN